MSSTVTQPRTVFAEPLTEVAYKRYGGVIAADLTAIPSTATNSGTAKRWHDVVKQEERYVQSGKPGRPVVSVSQSSPRVTTSDGDGRKTFVVQFFERHPYTTQLFLPMSADAEYLVVVADSKAGDPSQPDLGSVRAFVAKSGQGICYGLGLWHAPMAVVGPVSTHTP